MGERSMGERSATYCSVSPIEPFDLVQ